MRTRPKREVVVKLEAAAEHEPKKSRKRKNQNPKKKPSTVKEKPAETNGTPELVKGKRKSLKKKVDESESLDRNTPVTMVDTNFAANDYEISLDPNGLDSERSETPETPRYRFKRPKVDDEAIAMAIGTNCDRCKAEITDRQSFVYHNVKQQCIKEKVEPVGLIEFNSWSDPDWLEIVNKSGDTRAQYDLSRLYLRTKGPLPCAGCSKIMQYEQMLYYHYIKGGCSVRCSLCYKKIYSKGETLNKYSVCGVCFERFLGKPLDSMENLVLHLALVHGGNGGAKHTPKKHCLASAHCTSCRRPICVCHMKLHWIVCQPRFFEPENVVTKWATSTVLGMTGAHLQDAEFVSRDFFFNMSPADWPTEQQLVHCVRNSVKNSGKPKTLISQNYSQDESFSRVDQTPRSRLRKPGPKNGAKNEFQEIEVEIPLSSVSSNLPWPFLYGALTGKEVCPSPKSVPIGWRFDPVSYLEVCKVLCGIEPPKQLKKHVKKGGLEVRVVSRTGGKDHMAELRLQLPQVKKVGQDGELPGANVQCGTVPRASTVVCGLRGAPLLVDWVEPGRLGVVAETNISTERRRKVLSFDVYDCGFVKGCPSRNSHTLYLTSERRGDERFEGEEEVNVRLLQRDSCCYRMLGRISTCPFFEGRTVLALSSTASKDDVLVYM